VAAAGFAIGTVAQPVADFIRTAPAESTVADAGPLIAELQRLDAEQGRVEVVPLRTHWEASGVAPYVNLARGWNRQADVQRNPVFYVRGALTADSYRRWLRRWAVRYVVLTTTDAPDFGATGEARLVETGLPYLDEVWANSSWTLYAVRRPAPLVHPAATVVSFDADQLTLIAPAAGRYVVKVAASPWLSLVSADGRSTGAACLSDLDTEYPTSDGRDHSDNWVVLHAPAPGTYRISAPYKLPRGTPCAT
jgi:hypothetical protein